MPPYIFPYFCSFISHHSALPMPILILTLYPITWHRTAILGGCPFQMQKTDEQKSQGQSMKHKKSIASIILHRSKFLGNALPRLPLCNASVLSYFFQGHRPLMSPLSLITCSILFSCHRFNLDPLGVKTDEEIWKSLEIAQLKDLVMNFPELLGMFVHCSASMILLLNLRRQSFPCSKSIDLSINRLLWHYYHNA